MAERSVLGGWAGPEEELAGLEPSLDDAGEFWQRAEENLRAGNVRLVFACDRILASLQRGDRVLERADGPDGGPRLEVRRMQASGQELFHSRLIGATPSEPADQGEVPETDVIPTLVDAGLLEDGSTLWVLPQKLPGQPKPAADDPRLRMIVEDGRRQPKRCLRAPGVTREGAAASRAFDAVRRETDSSYTGDRTGPSIVAWRWSPAARARGPRT
ncbi:MAG: hypothetical protein M9964_05865 [Solirubrobacterales bacterium]|nr:hypothetical protein [Solirubrobacterales bacterium]